MSFAFHGPRFAIFVRLKEDYRKRAELLSALIGSISLIPFIISCGTSAEIEKPLAIVVVGGLVTRPD
jgi:Cu/Ag efflux pump CusA